MLDYKDRFSSGPFFSKSQLSLRIFEKEKLGPIVFSNIWWLQSGKWCEKGLYLIFLITQGIKRNHLIDYYLRVSIYQSKSQHVTSTTETLKKGRKEDQS